VPPVEERTALSATADPGERAPLPPPPAASRGGAQTGYGLDVLPPLNAVAELAAIMTAFLVADWVWPQLDIHNLQPSVYWLPVLLLSLQYGTASGSMAVIAAIAATFTLVTLPEQGVGENEFAYRLRILAQPILWIATAVLLGQFRMVQIAAKRELLQRVSELEEQGRTLAGYANRLRARCDALERDIVARREPGDGAVLATLARLREGALAPAPDIESILAACAPGGAASLFVSHAGGFVRVVSAGWPEDAAWAPTLAADHSLCAAVAGARKPVSVLEAAGETALAGQGLAAVPVLDPVTGGVTGMLKVESATGNTLTPALLGALSFLATVIAPRVGDIAAGAPLLPPAIKRTAAIPIPLRPLADKLEAAPAPRVWPKAGP